MRQTSGFPMGGHSSREILDVILLASEYRILSVMEYCPFYQRMVDDISCVFTCGIDKVKSQLELMAKYYPAAMPLNIQLSFGYSSFLDLSLIKLYQKNDNIRIIHSFMHYKELNQFDYVPFSSNVSDHYKGCIVPSFVHRARTLCSLSSSRSHNYSLLLKLLPFRGQNMDIIREKFKKSISRILNTSFNDFAANPSGVAVCTFDNTTSVHKIA